MKAKNHAPVKEFKAVLERRGPPLHWVVIRIPFSVERTWNTRGQLKVKGEINGFEFRTSLFATRSGEHIMIVNKRMQAAAKVSAGSVAQFRLEPDTGERRVAMPAELKRAMAEEPSLRRWYETLNYSTRKEIADWFAQVKSAEARARRAQQIAERLLATMEAERELPPMMQVAFAGNRRARQGWERMSAARRRMHLIAMFYYRDPEARARRLAKAVEDAARFGTKLRATK